MVSVDKKHFHSMGKKRILQVQLGCCFYCGEKLQYKDATRDHLMPKKDGNTLLLNCVISCYPCNTKKGFRPPTEKEVTKARSIYRVMGCPAFSI